MLDRHKIPFIAVDSNAGVTSQARSDGKPVYYGDASRPEYLRRCGLETARAVVVTMDSPTPNEAVVEATRRLRPDVTLVARARDADHARALYELGVTDAVPETIEASLQLSEAVLVDHRRADGPGHRLDPREARRVPQDFGRRWRARAAALHAGAATGVSGVGRRSTTSPQADGSARDRYRRGASLGPAFSKKGARRFSAESARLPKDLARCNSLCRCRPHKPARAQSLRRRRRRKPW